MALGVKGQEMQEAGVQTRHCAQLGSCLPAEGPRQGPARPRGPKLTRTAG